MKIDQKPSFSSSLNPQILCNKHLQALVLQDQTMPLPNEAFPC